MILFMEASIIYYIFSVATSNDVIYFLTYAQGLLLGIWEIEI